MRNYTGKTLWGMAVLRQAAGRSNYDSGLYVEFTFATKHAKKLERHKNNAQAAEGEYYVRGRATRIR